MNYFRVSKWFLLIPALCIAIVSTSTLFPFIVGKYSIFRASVDIALIFFLLGLLFSSERHIYETRLRQMIRSPLVIAVTLFVIAVLLACLFGLNPAYSFWSNFERGEGGLQVLNLYIFFLLMVALFNEERDWQKMFTWSLVGALLMTVYGFLASWGVKGFIGTNFSDGPGYRFDGSIGNPSYVAAYLVFALFYGFYLLRTKYKEKFKAPGAILLYASSALFLVVFYLAKTRGAFVGLVVSILAFLGYLMFSHKHLRKWLVTAIACVVLLVGGVVFLKDTPFVKALPGSRIFDISFSAQTFKDRAVMWKVALDGFRERPIFGWGPESFIQVFDRHFNIAYFDPTKDFGAWFDRAHSIYFDYLVETGLLGLVTYLGIFVTIYWGIFSKTKNNYSSVALKQKTDSKENGSDDNPHIVFQKAWLFALPLAYLVQGLVLFDVFPIYFNTFLMFAFAAYVFFPKTVVHHEHV